MPGLLLAETPSEDPSEADMVWPQTPNRTAMWARDLHDELERGHPVPEAELTNRIASWLRVQAVGRETVCVVEPRLSIFSAAWNAGATAAGLAPVGLRHADGSVEVLPTAEPAIAARDSVHAITVTAGWRYRARLWLADRGEDVARATVRAIQR